MAEVGVKFLKGLEENLAAKAIAAGQILFTTDTGKLFVDIDATHRVEFYDDAIRSVDYKDGKLNFYGTEKDGGELKVLDYINLPAEQFLDTNYTKFYNAFSKTTLQTALTSKTVTYPDDIDDYEGKAVLVLVMKDSGKTEGNDHALTDTYTVSILDMHNLVDSNKANLITLDATPADNADEIVTVKVIDDPNLGAASGAKKGDIQKSGVKISTAAIGMGTTEAAAQDPAVTATAVDTKIPTELAVAEALYTKMDKDTDAIENNIAKFDANGNPVDSGYKAGGDALIDTEVDATTNTGKVLATEKAVKAELDKKANLIDKTQEGFAENQIVLTTADGDIKTSKKTLSTTVLPAAAENAGDPIASDDVIPTEKAVRDAINGALEAGLSWGSF